MSVGVVSKADMHFQTVSSRGMTWAKQVGILLRRQPPAGRKAAEEVAHSSSLRISQTPFDE